MSQDEGNKKSDGGGGSPPSGNRRRRSRRPRRRGGKSRPGGQPKGAAKSGESGASGRPSGGAAKSSDAKAGGEPGKPRRSRRRRRPRKRGGASKEGSGQARQPKKGAQEKPARSGGGRGGRQKKNESAEGAAPGEGRRSRSRRRRRRRKGGAGPPAERAPSAGRQPQRGRQLRSTIDDDVFTEVISPEKAIFLTSNDDDPRQLAEKAPEYGWADGEKLFNIVSIRFSHSGRIEDFDAAGQTYDRGDQVIVETDKGLQLGVVSTQSRMVMRPEGRLPRVIRGMNENDDRQERRNQGKEEQAWKLCQELAGKYRLAMKLIAVDYLHGGNRAIFYFSAEGRIDFRQLVRDLASRLHTRIEMRQVGVRDASRFVGGLGPCGQCLCCNSFLQRFAPVSIRMAKDQNLVLNPQKVSGICGRLMCCLTYEQKGYEMLRKGLPKTGKRIQLTSGETVRVRDVDVLRRLVRVQFEDGSMKVVAPDDIAQKARGAAKPADNAKASKDA